MTRTNREAVGVHKFSWHVSGYVTSQASEGKRKEVLLDKNHWCCQLLRAGIAAQLRSQPASYGY